MKLIWIIIACVLFISCQQTDNNPIVQNYYYEFVGFDSTENAKLLLIDLTKTFSEVDFIITAGEVLKRIPRDTVILKDSLNKFHKVLHRVHLFSDKENYAVSDVKILVEPLFKSARIPDALHFYRYELDESGEWVLKYDLYEHKLFHGSSNPEVVYNFMVNEIARASFK